MESAPSKIFLRSAAVILCLTGVTKLWSAAGTARLLSEIDPLIHLTTRQIMVAVGLIELAIALFLLFGRGVLGKLWLVFWLGSNFLIYRSAKDLFHLNACPCLGTIARNLPLSRKQTDFLLMVCVLYLLCGSLFMLLSHSSTRPWTGGRDRSSKISM